LHLFVLLLHTSVVVEMDLEGSKVLLKQEEQLVVLD